MNDEPDRDESERELTEAEIRARRDRFVWDEGDVVATPGPATEDEKPVADRPEGRQ